MMQFRTLAAIADRIPPANGLVGLGLLIAGGAWTGLALSMLLRLFGVQAPPMSWLSFYIIILCAIITGMGLALLGALRGGLGALEKFFHDVLLRAAQRAQQTPSHEARRRDGVRQRGVIGNRPYILYDDGTVAVETLLGIRLFKTIAEAQEFIGA